MPSPIVHFVASLATGYGVGLRGKGTHKVVISCAIIQALVDLDHLLRGTSAEWKVFHTLPIFVYIPVCLLIGSLLMRRTARSLAYQRFFLILALVMAGHMLLDLFFGGKMMLFFPFDGTYYSISDIPAFAGLAGSVGTETVQWGLLFWCIIMVGGNFAWSYIKSDTSTPDEKEYGVSAEELFNDLYWDPELGLMPRRIPGRSSFG